ncbi:MAG: GH36-type glycosyl hydrolase domain-containing protein [Longimicrobiales bacterium]
MAAGPLRGELLGADHLGERARAVARDQTLSRAGPTQKRAPLLTRLKATHRILERAHARLSAGAGQGLDIGPAGVWLVENYHVVQEHIREVHESLPRDYYRELPELSAGPLAGYPRVYELATTLISHTDGRVDLDNVDLFVGSFQQEKALGIGELWAVPAMLRLALIESVRRMALRTVQNLDQVEEADRRAARIHDASAQTLPALETALREFIENPPRLTAIFVSRFLYHLREARAAFPALIGLERWIGAAGLSAEDAASLSTQRLALTQVVMANSITSLRVIGKLDWKSFVEQQSVMERVLRRDPVAYYQRMTFATRDHYRHVVERIAKRTESDEAGVARAAVDLAARNSADLRQSHVGYYLVDDGLRELERVTGYRRKLGEALHRAVLHHANVAFGGGILIGTAVTFAVLFWFVAPAHWTTLVVVALVALLPAFDIAVSAINQLVAAFLPPRLLPKLDLRGENGIPAEFRTAVVVPTLFPDVDAVREALETIEVQFLANREAHLHFAVLSDFIDAATATCQADGAIVQAAVDGVNALNDRYAPESADAFYLFHRSRRWNEQQGVWMGWERKRGKLAEFNRFLRGNSSDAFAVVVGNVEPLRSVRYVITLDADTVLPPEAAPLLIGALAHPLNRAVYDGAHQRVVHGYGILQPRVGVSLPSAHASRFAAIHSGHPGVDPYTTAVSDVYQDLYGEGSFTGKGIYEVDAFEQATHGRFPENQLLSHDLIEGSYARAGLTTDIIVYDDYPTRYLTYTQRKHRWIRGDWQLLDWLTPRVAGPDGPERNRLSLLSRWKIFDNLRRSLLELALLAFFIAGWTLLPGSPLFWTVLALAAVAAPWLLSLLLAAVRPPLDKSWRAYYSAVGRDAVTSAQQVGLVLAFLPHQAWISADAIVRTVWRVSVSRCKLLEWQTAMVTERVAASTARGTWRAMWPAVASVMTLLIVVLLVTLLTGPVPGQVRLLALTILPLGTLWLIAPWLAHALSRPTHYSPQEMRASQRPQALRYAALHWHFFDHFVSERTQGLAPDNYQEDPVPVVAMRTSPTNIGLQLLSVVSAYDLGFITVQDMTGRLEAVFRSLERMERFRGHFFNWYDLHDLRVLEPAYISTVDSGNLAGHLIALRQASLSIEQQLNAAHNEESADVASRLNALAERAYRYALEMDFSFLFDAQRKLFAIGYQPGTHSLDASYYDLLASEARLASFIAIAKNDVPVDHWFHLGRTLTHAAGATALVSWSGSMFEYLMPGLVMQSLPLTVLDQTYRGAVKRQIAYGSAQDVPWGMSEAAYAVRDRHFTYQYRAFGVPDLGLKYGLDRDLVVAPYASALASAVEPHDALANLAVLEKKGALGPYGFRDSLDYTRAPANQDFTVVRAYMAHHIGMSLVALTNGLNARVWQTRFHADPLIRSAELLLHERVPRRLLLHKTVTPHAVALPELELDRPSVREFETPDTAQPQVALLGQLPYTIMVSHCGAGYSRYQDLTVTRWRSDATMDNTGQFCFLKDLTSGRVWSAAHQPVCAPADWYRAVLATDRVTFQRGDGAIETRTEIAIVPQDSAEVRRVTVTNNGSETREVELTSYGEVVLAPPDAERAHPAFANLFVETEFHAWCNAITATRRRRSATERSLVCVHVVATGKERVGAVTCETDRARFIGRGRSTRDPLALDRDGALSGTTGAVLDPIFALRTRVRLSPGQSASVAFTTLIAETSEQAFALADRYDNPHAAQRALDLAWTSTQVELRELNIAPAEAALFQQLAGHLLYAGEGLGAALEERSRNRGSQPLLWPYGISGDRPILLASMKDAEGLPTMRQLFAAHHYWRRRGLQVDLVVLTERPASYLHELDDSIYSTLASSSDAGVIDQPGGVFIRSAGALSPAALLMLRSTARVRIVCDGRSLGRILEGAHELEPDARGEPAPPPRLVERQEIRADRAHHHAPDALTGALHTGDRAAPHVRYESPGQPAPPHAQPLEFDNGLGGIDGNGDYRIRVRGDSLPPAPWANVIANPFGGFIVTERGAGFTWAENSYFYRLTPWHNDPVCDPMGEVLYLRDGETGECWSPTPAPIRDGGEYAIRHGAGSSTFQHRHGDVASELTLGMVDGAAVKIARLRLTNHGQRARRLSLTAYIEWTLGALRDHTHHVRTVFQAELGALCAYDTFDPHFAGWTAFCSLSEPVTAYTADRREFIGRNGTLADPAGLRGPLSGAIGSGLDPCAALQCELTLGPGETRAVVMLLGAAASQAEAERLLARYRDPNVAHDELARSVAAWHDRLSIITVQTPEPAFDVMMNHWSPYQALSSRMWARSGFYQSSGAYGFRDQLQDVMAFVYAEPCIARAHILRAAARQFLEGDVQHWWHPHTGRGVRTRFSDDLAWLPFVTEHYTRVTGDVGILDENVPFLMMRALEPNEHELYDLPDIAREEAPLYEHCMRALRKACTSGAHGLPLIGSGDWNDGMNRVGIEGRGESIWLAWFLTSTLRNFARIADTHGDRASASELRARATEYVNAVEQHGWDGEWYRRAYFDDGTPLGSAQNEECRIDAIAQSWSVISGAGAEDRQERALQSLEDQLIRNGARIVQLLSPPFDRSAVDPGYIKGYLPGVRENGAQYTHAALWTVLASALRGAGDRAFDLLQMLNPLTRAVSPAGVDTYKVEPYVIAADVYTANGQLGRGGWTWYTGSASWFYRVGLEAILGFRKAGDSLVIQPCVPSSWRVYRIEYRSGRSLYSIEVQNPTGGKHGVWEVSLDGRVLPNAAIPLTDDGAAHSVVVRLL